MTGMTITHRDQFAFMAWRRNPERDPRFRLQTESEAMEEAQRLAQQRPGSTYIVMREIARVSWNNSDPAVTPEAAGGAGRLGLSILSVRPRITELARDGKVRDSGDRRHNASGKRAIVWAPVNPARLKGRAKS